MRTLTVYHEGKIYGIVKMLITTICGIVISIVLFTDKTGLYNTQWVIKEHGLTCVVCKSPKQTRLSRWMADKAAYYCKMV